ncbi:MAG: SDR family oxidoreductase [Myxococcales bacterium]|nr:SDR family oxidoreductase [Myxococcales bacterium]MCB9582674.1 SDR family oxidoreductase [Polyangiaceae bacterium]
MALTGSWALVTGASSGIGEALARQLAEKGANVVLTARSRDKLSKLADELSARDGVQTQVVVGDLARPGGAEELLRDVASLGVELDHLVNNAGFGSAGPFVERGRHAEMVRLNCEALVALTHGLLPAMVRRGRGGVLNVASTAAFQPMPFMATYAATKAFVLSFSTALAEEVAPHGITVTALCPGPVPTGFQETAGITPGAERMAALSADQTAAIGIAGYMAGRRVVVPGGVNRVQTTLTQLLPRRAVTALLAGAMRRMGRAD